MQHDAIITGANTDAQYLQERKQDTVWMLSLYGTAIGAGTLFLPIDAGLHGIIPLIIIALLAFPMTYLSHKGLCRFVLSSASNDRDITHVMDEHFGERAGKYLTFFYFLSIYPVLLMYGVAMTNTTQSFLIHQIHITPPPRAFTALALVLALMIIVRFGQESIIKAMSLLVYPFVSILLLLSLYLIPHWSDAILRQSQNLHGGNTRSILSALWLLIPLVVFSFNHTPIISSFAVTQKQRFQDKAEDKSSLLLKYTHILMVVTVMFFVLSCVLSLSPEDLRMAKQQNISILSYLANHFHTPFIAYIAPFVAFIAISKSYLGHFMGASEGLLSLVYKGFVKNAEDVQSKTIKFTVELFIIATCWLVATLNPNILTMIETLGGPITAIILFIMPVYAIWTVPAMQQYRRPIENSFVAVMGCIAISAIIYGLWKTFCGV